MCEPVGEAAGEIADEPGEDPHGEEMDGGVDRGPAVDLFPPGRDGDEAGDPPEVWEECERDQDAEVAIAPHARRENCVVGVGAGFPPEEKGGYDDRDNEGDQDVGGRPSFARTRSDGEDEQNDSDSQNADSRNIKFDVFRLVPLGGWNKEETDTGDGDSDDCHEPEDPGPPGVLNEYGADKYAEHVPNGSRRAEKGDRSGLVGGIREELDDEGKGRWNR